MKLLLLEDDLWAKKSTENLIKTFFPDIEIIGAADNLKDALIILNNTKPDFILADIQLGDENVFDLMPSLEEIHNYNFVITTSHENYALEAFSNEVVDYIVKPVTLEKLTTAIIKVRRRLNNPDSAKLGTILHKSDNRMLGLSSIDKIEVVNLDAIIYLQADGRYTYFHMLDGSRKIASKNLGEYEKILPVDDFLRVHHSYILNMSYVKTIIKTDGFFAQLFKSKTLIPVSKRKQEALSKFLKLKM